MLIAEPPGHLNLLFTKVKHHRKLRTYKVQNYASSFLYILKVLQSLLAFEACCLGTRGSKEKGRKQEGNNNTARGGPSS